MHRLLSALVFLSALSALSPGRALGETSVPKPLQGIDIVEKPGSRLPLDLSLRDQSGQVVSLGSYFGEKPVVLVLAYYQCPMLCTLVLNGVTEGLKGLAWAAGNEFRVLTVSIDPRDSASLAREKRQNYLAAYGRPVSEKGWDFLTGDEGTVRALAESVGFGYRWDGETKQFAHAAGLFVLTPDGRLSRTLYGVRFKSSDLRLALLEASQGKLGSAWERVILFCFHYDPSARGYVLATTRIVKASGVLTILILGGFLLRLWRRERRQATGSPEHGQ
ncbi:MAG: SCO family protein [Deltaproteobacteria bacterium]|nr:SCO family protein [Deltaproteobacteria bacterium]